MSGVRQDEPFEIQPQANGVMARALQVATAAALILGVVGAVLPGSWGKAAAWAAVGVVVVVPLGRVCWLGVRWVQRRDYRYAAIAFALLGIVVAGAVVAALVG
ncbi:MAG: hypothetical protein ACR2HR_09665 [Euzebya sp.]